MIKLADITGINIAKVGTIKEAITAWRKEIEAVDIISSSKQVAVAVKGTNKEAEVKSLCQSMTSYVKNLTRKLEDYNKRLDEVIAAYKKNDSTNPSKYLSTVRILISLPLLVIVLAILFEDTKLPILSNAKLATLLSEVSSVIFLWAITSFIIISL